MVVYATVGEEKRTSTLTLPLLVEDYICTPITNLGTK
jgi:hypothetical protein